MSSDEKITCKTCRWWTGHTGPDNTHCRGVKPADAPHACAGFTPGPEPDFLVTAEIDGKVVPQNQTAGVEHG